MQQQLKSTDISCHVTFDKHHATTCSTPIPWNINLVLARHWNHRLEL